MSKTEKFIKNPALIFATLGFRGFFHWMDDKKYISILYKARTGKTLNLKNPRSFNEKLQWLKLYDRNPKYTMLVDKYEVKKSISSKLGEQYIIPTLGVWSEFDQIDFNKLPNQFVLKCTHDSGGLVICRDKSKFDVYAARKKICKSLKRNFYYAGREWPYKNVKPRIIAEEYMEDSESKELKDYKFYCFNGEVKFLSLSEGLENHSTARFSYVSTDWTPMDFIRAEYPGFDTLPSKPINLEKMVKFAKLLSQGIPFLRVDFYEINKEIKFGELTFYPSSGCTCFVPDEWDKMIGDFLVLPDKDIKK